MILWVFFLLTSAYAQNLFNLEDLLAAQQNQFFVDDSMTQELRQINQQLKYMIVLLEKKLDDISDRIGLLHQLNEQESF